uniref:thiamine phosphate synthase n=1 Tax=Alistipes sp. TaxID=1872444 RepID=UPI0040575E8E
MKDKPYRLQFITHYNAHYSYLDSARIALEGGCRWLQLRMKEADEAQLEETALILQRMCRAVGATFIIDDHVALAKRIGADGVHLGKNDMPIAEARNYLGDGFIIGGTINSMEDVLHHLEGGRPDYFGCGPYRFTSTKRNLAPVLGCEGYRDLIQKMRTRHITIPLVAIGGIRKEDIPSILACGVDGIALSGSIINAEEPVREMRQIADLFKL